MRVVVDAEEPQLELIPALAQERLAQARSLAAEATARTTAREKARPEAAEHDPVARVLVDVALPHLDRPFDYLVPATMADKAVPGCRVKVRFAGQDVDGFVLERCATSEHSGRLAPLRRVVSSEPVLAPQVARLSSAVAERYAGSRADVLRLAIPPRHATVEKEPPRAPAPRPVAAPPAVAERAWSAYDGGGELVRSVSAGRTSRSVWTALPGEDWPRRYAELAAAAARRGTGVLLCVPDHRDLARLTGALEEALGSEGVVSLSADLGPAPRYRNFLAVSRGAVRVVAGTRAAAFAPVADLGLILMWDDGDDLYAEPRAPYPHAREVLLQRAQDEGVSVVLGAYSRSVEAALLVSGGWARAVAAERSRVRAQAPQVSVTGATDRELERDPMARHVRFPSSAHAAVRAALEEGPVLVVSARSGYAAALACEECRAPARCMQCAGPLHQPAPHRPPQCRWCDRVVPDHACARCGARGLRAPVLGESRTAEELGRAFPGVAVRRSGGDRVLDRVPGDRAIVVSTPGAEPLAEGGYAAVVVLDTWVMLARPDLRTEEECARRWFNAAALARPAPEGGRVVLVGDPALPVLQALVRWDPAGFADREAEERRSAHLPPASRVATVAGPDSEVTAFVGALALPAAAEVLGPVPHSTHPDQVPHDLPPDEVPVRVVIRVPRRDGPALSAALRAGQGVRSARKLPPVRVQVDPVVLG